MALIPPGTYTAHSLSQALYENAKGSLVLCLNCEILDADHAGATLKSYQTLAKADGEISTRNIDNLKEIFGWDGADPTWFMEAEIADKSFTIVTEITEKQKEDGTMVQYSQVKWINPMGYEGAGKMPDNADKKSILAKYGSKFRALAGGTPPVKKPTTPPPAPSTPPLPLPAEPPPKKKKKVIAESTQEKAWEACCRQYADVPEDARVKKWYDALERLFAGKQTATLKPAEWAKVELEFTDELPY